VSYILDALRKSDQQRRRGAAPTLLVGQAMAVAPKRPAFLAYGMLVAVLIAAGVVIGWPRPWQPEQAAPSGAELVAAKPLASTPRQLASAPSETAPQPKPELQAQKAKPPAQASPVLVPTKPQRPAREKPKTDGAPLEADAAMAGNAEAPAPGQPGGSAAADAARLQTVNSMAELPLSVQQELPAMAISVHAYSGNPRNRLVGINNRILREGEYVVPGLKLEQVTPDGMIFGYKGYSFRRGLK
jgi:general secretion pathway protein B